MAETNLNLNFKHGTQASLNGLTTSDKGTFYLTNDTNRLYIGTGNSAPVLLNQTVNVISGAAVLPTPEEKLLNDFYYCAKENVLAVCVATVTEGNVTVYKWHQINKNTNDNTDTAVTEIAFNEGVVDTDNGTVTYTLTLDQVSTDLISNKETDLSPITATLTLNSEILASIVPEQAQVGVTLKEDKDAVTIIASGAGSSTTENGVTITGGGSTSVSAKDGVIEITSSEPIMNVADNTISLTHSNNQADTVGFTAGTDININTEDGNIVINHSAKQVTETTKDISKAQYISDIEYDNGHLSKIVYSNIVDNDTKVTGGQIISIDGADAPALEISSDNSQSVQISLDKIYTDLKTYTNDVFATVEAALQYKGKLTIAEALGMEEKPDAGAVYMAAEAGTFVFGEGEEAVTIANVKLGDLLVFNGEQFDVIPSGDELCIDTTYTGKVEQVLNDSAVIGATFTLTDSTAHDVASLTIKEGANIDVEVTDSEITISHDKIGQKVTDQTDTAATTGFTGITDLSFDEYGHIVGYTKGAYEHTTPEFTLSDVGGQLSLNLTHNSQDIGVVPLTSDGMITAEKTANDELKIGHATVAEFSPTESAANLGNGNTFTITTHTFDAYGHRTGAAEKTYTLVDKDTTYSLQTRTNGVALVNSDNHEVGSITFASSSNNVSLSCTATTNGNVTCTADLVWDTFN